MNICSYCGAEYSDDVLECPIDHTPLVEKNVVPAPNSPPPAILKQPEYEFAPLSPADRQREIVTLVTCRTLLAADLVVSRLRAAGISTFIPDEFLMQMTGFNFNTFGYVRVQVAPRNYEAARDLLSGIDQDADPTRGGIQ
jgi:hypothetical protein